MGSATAQTRIAAVLFQIATTDDIEVTNPNGPPENIEEMAKKLEQELLG